MRNPTRIDEIADNWTKSLVEKHPLLAVSLGWEDNGACPDYSPEAVQGYAQALRRVISELEKTAPVDDVDRVSKREMLRSLRLDLELIERDFSYRDLNVLHCPPLALRAVFDQMKTETEADWELISTRLGNLPASLTTYIQTLSYGIEKASVPARRQVELVAKQLSSYAAKFFPSIAEQAKAATAPALAAQIEKEVRAVSESYDDLAAWLRTELAPKAKVDDAFGPELYPLMSSSFLGKTVDLDEAYEWGREELARTVQEQNEIADRLYPGATVAQAVERLDEEPRYKLNSPEELKAWMQQASDAAIDALAGKHFDIPDQLRALECCIAPAGDGAIYYTGPSEDFSRPGRMWWSIPDGVTSFNTWRELTTVYHEGVPGHHLQVATATYNRDLNTWRRNLSWSSGHGEGWALYAERLMDDLGFLSDPANRLGMLDGQRMRAARVVLDIGVHLKKEVPEGGRVWDADYALEFMKQHVNMPVEFIQFEVNRYLGWAGQAPSYKIGQRVWEQLRDRFCEENGPDLRAFHTKALALGGVSLETLEAAMLNKL